MLSRAAILWRLPSTRLRPALISPLHHLVARQNPLQTVQDTKRPENSSTIVFILSHINARMSRFRSHTHFNASGWNVNSVRCLRFACRNFSFANSFAVEIGRSTDTGRSRRASAALGMPRLPALPVKRGLNDADHLSRV